MSRHVLHFEPLEDRQLLSGLIPSQLQEFYRLNAVYNHDPATRGAGVSIAVVVPFDDPTADQDITAYFDRPNHLAPLSLTTYNLAGSDSQQSLVWSTEAEIDVEMIHTIAPLAHVDLVEAVDNGLLELMRADQYAASLPGVVAVSVCWGAPEYATESQLDPYLSAPGVTFIAASGDLGYVQYPSASPDVIAVGGTWVSGTNETAWPSSGAGASLAYPGRTVPDLSMAVDSSEGLGTSVSAPLFAGIVGIADALREQDGLPTLSAPEVRELMNSVVRTPEYRAAFNHVGGRSSTGLGSPKAPGLIALLDGSALSAITSVKVHHDLKSHARR